MIVQCPFCHYKEAVPEEYAGMIGECSNCGKEFKITKPMSFQQQMPYQREKAEEAYPILCFVLGFFFSLIGILVAFIIDKKNIGKAVIGFFSSLILGLMVSIVACRSYSNQKKLIDVQSEIQEIQSAVENYWVRELSFPTDLGVLVGPSNYFKSTDKIIDPWGTRYRIETHDSSVFVIISAGPDKNFGTSDDITSN